MAANKARDELLALIDKKAFDPVLKANPKDYDSPDKQELLSKLQSTTESTKRSYHKERSASGVLNSYRSDLSSDSAKKVQREIRSLGLPTLPDIKEEVERKAKELKVRG